MTVACAHGEESTYSRSVQVTDAAVGGTCHTMRFGGTAKVLAKCKLEYCRVSECAMTQGPAIVCSVI